LNIKTDCLFIDSPTASGKTFAFILPSATTNQALRRYKTLIISPNNLLISQTFDDMNEIISNNDELHDLKIAKIYGKEFTGLTLWERAKKMRESFSLNDIVISNPDVIALFLTGFYNIYRGNRTNAPRLRNTADIFSEIDIIIFDEFHVYSEEELGKMCAFLFMAKLIGRVPKIIFTSATPSHKIKELLSILDITYSDLEVKPYDHETPNSRRIRGEIELTVTSSPIKDSLSSALNILKDADSKILFLFDHKIDAEISRSILLDLKMDEKMIKDLSGFSNRAMNKIPITGMERCIIATNAAEQGLNLDVSISHIEPGLYKENLIQRYGRIGRQGRSGEITIHVNEYLEREIPEEISDFTDFMNKIDKILFEKDVYLSRIKRHFAAFMSLCTIRSSRNNFAQQIKQSILKLNDRLISEIYNSILSFNGEVDKISELYEPNPEDIKDLKDWWNNFLLSIGYFRGETMSVVVGLNRGKNIMKTTEDIIWVKKWCNFELIKEDSSNMYLIKSFKPVPSTVELNYRLPTKRISVTENEMRDRQRFSDKYSREIKEFMYDILDGYDIDLHDAIDSLSSVVKIIFPGMLKPVEVENATKSQII
jgi:CRISPR-associated helicase Cas3